jgi:putative acetyltransferase
LLDEMLKFKPYDLRSLEAHSFVAELNTELSAMYPEEGATHFRLNPAEVQKGKGVFLIAVQGNSHLGCGALRTIDELTGELKRMYVKPEARKKGVGRELVRALEKEAKALGLTRIVLETGERQLAAIALYKGEGYYQIPAYGEYVNSPLSICMAKDI